MNIHKILANAVVLAGFVAVPFIPFIVLSQSTFFPFIVGKNFAFRIVVELMFSAWLVLAYIDPAYRPKRSYLLGAFVALLGIITLSAIFGENPTKSFWSNFERMEGVVTYFHLFAYFIVSSTVLTVRNLWRPYLNLHLVAGVIMAIYGVLQWAGDLTIVQDGMRVNGTLGNAAYLGTYALINIFLAMSFFVKKNSATIIQHLQGAIFSMAILLVTYKGFYYFHVIRGEDMSKVLIYSFFIAVPAILWALSMERTRVAMCGTIIFLQAFVLYHTATRGAMLGLIVGIGLTMLLIAIFERERKVLRNSAIGVLVAVVVLVGGFIAMRNAQFVKDSPVLARFGAISLTEQTTKSRFMVWNMAYQGFKEHPGLGWGMENFNYVFNKYYDPKMHGQEQWFDRAHNVFFDWLIAGGAPGLLAYISLFACAVYCIWRRTDELSILEKSVLTGLLWGYFFQNLFVFDNLTSLIYFGTILAYIESVNRSPEVLVKTKISKKGNEEAEDLTILVSGGAVIIALVLVYFVNYNGFLQNTTLIHAMSDRSKDGPAHNLELFKEAIAYGSFGTSEAREQLGQLSMNGFDKSKGISEIQNSFIDLAAKELTSQAASLPNDARYQFFAGSFLVRVGHVDEALPYLERAAELSPAKQTILFELANAYYNKKDIAKSEEVFKRAYELAPEYQDAENYYIQILRISGNRSELERVIKAHIARDPSFAERGAELLK